MFKKFEAERFSRNYDNYKAASHKYRQEGQKKGKPLCDGSAGDYVR